MVGIKRGCLIGAVAILGFSLQPQIAMNLFQTTSAACRTTKTNGNYSYPEFMDPSPINVSAAELKHTNRLIHNAQFGLGHRLGKISGAWHLTKSLNLTRMILQWMDCSGQGNVFPLLFGSDHIDVPGSEEAALKSIATGSGIKTVSANNDVSGYYGANNFKIHQIPLSQNYKNDSSPFWDKLDSDLQLFKILRRRFEGRQDMIRFMDEHRFRDHFVIGVHLRLGNGEGQHFTAAKRGVDNQHEFTYNLIDLIGESFLEKMQMSYPERFVNVVTGECSSKQRKPPLLFLATDSPKFIPIIANYTALYGVKTVVMPQTRVESGVTFSAWRTGEKCVRGWRDMLTDAMLLSFSDALIAARHSSFTQIMPMRLAFDRGNSNRGPRFCEVSDTAKSMTCFEDIRTWLFRDNAEAIFTYAHRNVTEAPVVHSLHVHLPDVDVSNQYLKAKSFLDSSNKASGTLTYGEPFDQKYRKKLVCPACTEFKFI